MIIGLTGTNGSGKGELASYFVDQGFVHLSVRSFLTRVLTERGIEATRPAMRELANELRSMHGGQYVIAQLFQEAQYSDRDVVIESVRTLAEAKLFTVPQSFLLAVDADVDIRYARVIERKSSTDFVTKEVFIEQEVRESNGVGENEMNIGACMAMAHVTFKNDGSLEELRRVVGEWYTAHQ